MGSEFEDEDRRAAANLGQAAKAAGVARIIYLGGLGREEEELSPHLRSRQEVGEILRDLDREGLIELGYRTITVVDGARLREIVDA